MSRSRRSAPGPSPVLTPRGRAVAGGGAALLAGGWLLGIPGLFGLGLAALAVLAVAAATVGLRAPTIEADHRLRAELVGRGCSTTLVVTVSNPGKRPTPMLVALDPVAAAGQGPSGQGLFLPREAGGWLPLGVASPGGAATAEVTLACNERGRWTIGPLVIATLDPFNLACRPQTVAGALHLTVHPEVITIPPPPAALAGGWRLRGSGGAPTGGADLAGVRPYREGDDLRRVHWAATAGHDDLMIREYDGAAAGRVTLLGDLRQPAVGGEPPEEVLAALASVAVAAIRAGQQLRLLTTGPFDSGWLQPGPDGLALVLDHLATAQPSDPDGLDAALIALATGAGHHGDAAVVVTTTTIGPSETRACRRAVGGYRPGLVLAVGPDLRPAPGTNSRSAGTAGIPIDGGPGVATTWLTALEPAPG